MLPSGEKTGSLLVPFAAGQQTRLAAFTRNQPEIAGIGERDVRFGKRGLLHEQRTSSMRAESTNEDSNDQEQRERGISS